MEDNKPESSNESLPAKTPKQLKKEAEKAAKLEKFKAKQEKLSAVDPKTSDKPKKKEIPAKPKAIEIESNLEYKNHSIYSVYLALVINSSSSPSWTKKGCKLSITRILQSSVCGSLLVLLVGKRRIFYS